ncbi:MAG: kynureninase [Planctomycetes bacterium]|nr:kynureninase [Planctomycetota bacterium]
MNSEFQPEEAFARQLDEADPLRGYREQFHIPRRPDGEPVIYFCGNSLGLQPKSARAMVEQEMDDWADSAVDAHFKGDSAWYPYHDLFRETGARLVGARPGEVVMMNSLTVNLHFMMVSFYQPTKERYKILIDYPTFPSDTYAIKSQLQHHGYDARDALVILKPRDGEHTIRAEDIERTLADEGERIALVMLAGVNFFTGQLYDMEQVTRLAHQHGCTVGFDLAHAAGNVPLQLHDWGVDFAVWCSYKYLNSGPGAIAGCFVHEKHWRDADLPRFAGWWGNDPDKRFLMHLLPDFEPVKGAAGWQISNPPILSAAPLRASLELFDAAGMSALRAKSEKLTGYLQYLLGRLPADRFEVITPGAPERRGCQLSILMHDRPKEYHRALLDAGVVCDFREPNVVRVAPVPLYNTFHEVWRFAEALAK